MPSGGRHVAGCLRQRIVSELSAKMLVDPGNDVAGFIKRLAVDEQAGHLLFAADLNQGGCRIAISRDVDQGNRHALAVHKVEHPDAEGAGRTIIQGEFMIGVHAVSFR